jgi:hypothetical protein
MKITKNRLKKIIKEELKKIFEGYEKKEEGVLVDLYEFASLVTKHAPAGKKQLTITVKNSRDKVPETMTLSLVDEAPTATARNLGPVVLVTNEMFGVPFDVQQIQPHVFILN